MYKKIEDLREIYRFRSDFIKTIREYFTNAGVIEVDTPIITPYPSHDLNISPFEIDYLGRTYYLATSPEFFLKRILTSKIGDIFEIAHSFRVDPVTSLHNPEFLLLEWYRIGWTYIDLIRDLKGLLNLISSKFSLKREYINKEWEIVPLREVFYRYTHIDLEDLFDYNRRREIAKREGYADEDFSTIFYKLFITYVEDKLGEERPTVIYDYPEVLGGFAKRTDRDQRFTQRIELYLSGIEIANGYTEIIDPKEQKERWEHYRQKGLPYDEDFLYYLSYGMPDAAGIALGIDRLMMFFLDKNDIGEVFPFSFKYFTKGSGGLYEG